MIKQLKLVSCVSCLTDSKSVLQMVNLAPLMANQPLVNFGLAPLSR